MFKWTVYYQMIFGGKLISRHRHLRAWSYKAANEKWAEKNVGYWNFTCRGWK